MLLLLLLACAQPDATEVLDVRVPVPADGTAFVSPEFQVDPYEEVQVCTFGTWTGGDLAVHRAIHEQDAEFGHHVVLYASLADVGTHPDGETVDCSDGGASLMLQTRPLLIPNRSTEFGGIVDLPDGMAVKLADGQRWMMQSHYVNWGEQPLLARDVIALETMPAADVKEWVGTFAQASLDMVLPPHEVTTVKARCRFEQDATVLSLFGHMHEHGVSFVADKVATDGARERVYEVPDWDPAYRDAPPIVEPPHGALQVLEGDAFDFDCVFDNFEEEELRFPEEMCAFAGLMYPAEEPVYCGE